MKSLQDMLTDINGAVVGSSDSYKSVQEMVYEIWQCIEVDEETGEKYLKVKVSEE